MVEKLKNQAAEKVFFGEDDIIEAMRELPGYIDVTPHDFKQLYEKVYKLAQRRILERTSVGQIMTSPVHVVEETADLESLVNLLADKHISGVPVIDGAGKLTGVASEKDILRAMGEDPSSSLMRLVASSWDKPMCLRKDIKTLPVKEIMNAPPLSIQAAACLGDVVRLFQQKTINRLPVVDDSGSVVGIITRSNVISAVSNL